MLNSELMAVKQLPIIAERLESIRAETEDKVNAALSLVCTDETLQTVKKVRADLNRDFAELEAQRKEVKRAIMKPYEDFEALYRECVTDVFQSGIGQLGGKIDAVEEELKAVCRDKLDAYFCELCAVKGIDFLTFGQTGVRVDLASARQETPKKLMEQIRLSVESVAQAMETIQTMPDGSEIMVEYKKNLNLTAAIMAVQDRKNRIVEEKKRQEEREAAERELEKRRSELAAFEDDIPPAPLPQTAKVEAEKKLTVKFTVTDTKERLSLLKRFLTENGYKYQ